MATPNPLAPTKGAGTTLWVYTGTGDPYANPLSDVDWLRLAKIKDLQPGELTAESEDDTYVDDDNADWTSTINAQDWPGAANVPLQGKPTAAGEPAPLARSDELNMREYEMKSPSAAGDISR
ncbi:phage tail protein, partial [Klebsiella pneumoniae]